MSEETTFTSVPKIQLAPTALVWNIAYNDIAWLVIDVPANNMNILQASFINQFSEILTELETKKNIKGLVLHSAKPDNFVVSADVRMLDACKRVEDAQTIAQQGQKLFSRLEALPFHVVAAIHGSCLGGGLELALACHSRVATNDAKTRIGLPEVQLGLLPGFGGTQRLPRLIGVARSLDMILTGKELRGEKAKNIGVVDDCVSHSVLLQIAEEWALKSKPKRKSSWQNWIMDRNILGRAVIFEKAAKKIRKKTRGNYPAMEAILDTVRYGLEKGVEKGLSHEAQYFGQLVMSPESAALRNLFFATTALKKETGADAEPEEITGVTVLGGGLMGAGIANVSATTANVPVRVKDVSYDALLNVMSYSFKLLEKKRKHRIISKVQLQKQMAHLSCSTDYSGMTHNNVVIEAVFEDLELKHKMVVEVEKSLRNTTIFATNTSSLSIYQIADGATRPENIIGLHYFSPVNKMLLVEVIPHTGTSAKTIATVVKLVKMQGKIPIMVADKVGFYVNRILAPYINEAAMMLLSGESIEHIDTALLNFGFPVGPVTLLDEVGIDIFVTISSILFNGLGERFRAPDIFDVMLNNGRKGRKNGKGFYQYSSKKKMFVSTFMVCLVLNLKINSQLTRLHNVVFL